MEGVDRCLVRLDARRVRFQGFDPRLLHGALQSRRHGDLPAAV